jgi:hypothetical protein
MHPRAGQYGHIAAELKVLSPMLAMKTRAESNVSTGARGQEAVARTLAIRYTGLSWQSSSMHLLTVPFRFGNDACSCLTFRKVSAIIWGGAERSSESEHATVRTCPKQTKPELHY